MNLLFYCELPSLGQYITNGGDIFDSCAADGYVQSIYTIPVGAYNQMGGPAFYDEKCSAKMTVAYVYNNSADATVHVVRSLFQSVFLRYHV